MRIRIFLPDQSLQLSTDAGTVACRFPVSTSSLGAGELRGSYQTPRGRHVIRAMIGRDAPAGTVFVGRRPTGEIWNAALHATHPGRDWILSRILWLSGKEPGRNRLGAVDTMARHIYIHGTPDSENLGEPCSRGCVRMNNEDIVALFDQVTPGTSVSLVEYALTPGPWQALGTEAGRIREQVFVMEQGVPPDLEYDGIDPHCTHALAVDAKGQAIGTGRLLPDGHIGRMAVLPPWRDQGVGGALLETLMHEARVRHMDRVMLNAQQAAVGFYQRFGFTEVGETFMEAGIPHQAMVRPIGEI